MTNKELFFRAYRCHQLGDYHDLQIDELESLEPAADEIIISNRAFAVGFPEFLMIRGEYQLKPPLPFTPGPECSGTVEKIGRNVAGFDIGDRVFANTRVGSYAESVRAESRNCFQLPQNFDFAQGASYLAAYKTAYVGLVERGHLQAGETLLVHGAAGGVGLAAVELGKLLGATVIATGSSSEKLKVVQQKGADHVINISEGSFRDEVKDLTNGKGANVIYDPVGGDVFDESMRSIAPFGRLLTIGFASGTIPSAAVNYILIKQIAVVGVRAGEYGRIAPEAGERVHQALLQLAKDGKLNPHIHKRFKFEQLVAAFDEIVERRVVGRVVVEI